jgi:hypothetical protein
VRAPNRLALVSVTACAAAACTFHINPNEGRFSCVTDKDCGSGYQCIQQLAIIDGGLCFPAGLCRPEVCNGLDDDCDGLVDNGFDLQHDNSNCGACGHLCPSGTGCDGGVCREVDCDDGIDNDNNGLTDCDDPNCPGRSCSATDAGVNCGTAWSPVDSGFDAGNSDGGVTDGGAADGGGADGGSADAGSSDGGAADGGGNAGDGGSADGGGDAGEPADAGSCAGGTADSGVCPGFTPTLACVPREVICDDGIDNDGNGYTDCADSNCDGRTCAPGKVCAQGQCQ